ncbi:MAG: histidinol-phosphate transaminase [Actinomycetota bacterium]|nr:MAG: histidinol-phosphate transaminase [Actinomycetota bacterium]
MAPGPRARAALAGIPTYNAGQRPRVRTDLTVYKASSNENPYPPLPSVVDAIARAAAQANRYPDPASTRLVAAIAAHHDVPADHVAVGTGSVALCSHLVSALAGPGDEVLYAWRSFEAYPICVQVAGAASVAVPLLADERHDLPGMAAAIGPRTRLVFVCNPNNPTGQVVHAAELAEFLDAVPPDVLVVMDEAYVEFVRDPQVPDGIRLYRDRPNVAVLRTFSKAYGLAGLRVGYLVAHPEVAAAARLTSTPFGVSVIAEEAAIASLAAHEELAGRVASVVAERDRFVAGLRAAGLHLEATQANFVWLRLADRAAEFARACEEAGVTIRPYAGEGVRITVAEPEANDRVVAVARQFVTANGPAGEQ